MKPLPCMIFPKGFTSCRLEQLLAIFTGKLLLNNLLREGKFNIDYANWRDNATTNLLPLSEKSSHSLHLLRSHKEIQGQNRLHCSTQQCCILYENYGRSLDPLRAQKFSWNP